MHRTERVVSLWRRDELRPVDAFAEAAGLSRGAALRELAALALRTYPLSETARTGLETGRVA